MLLIQHGRWSSSYYLSGYALELALKACIADLVQAATIPDKAFINAIYTHDLAALVSIAGLKAAFEKDRSANQDLDISWAIASKWTESSRYEPWDSVGATHMVASIADPANGVFQWVKNRW